MVANFTGRKHERPALEPEVNNKVSIITLASVVGFLPGVGFVLKHSWCEPKFWDFFF